MDLIGKAGEVHLGHPRMGGWDTIVLVLVLPTGSHDAAGSFGNYGRAEETADHSGPAL